MFVSLIVGCSLPVRGALTFNDISNTDAFQYSNIQILGGTGLQEPNPDASYVGMFGGVGYPSEPGRSIFTDYVFYPSLEGLGNVSEISWRTNTPTTLTGVNLFLIADDHGALADGRSAQAIALIADTNGIPGFQSTDAHVVVTPPYVDTGTSYQAFFYIPFSVTATDFLFEAEPYFSIPNNAYLGPRVDELDAVVPEPSSVALLGAAVAPLFLRRRSGR